MMQWVWCCHSNGEVREPRHDRGGFLRYGHEVQTQGDHILEYSVFRTVHKVSYICFFLVG